ncbi:hypothetical protein [Psychroflexus sp. MES1-P1E]|uniref:hypothetical protein n=1 Tax=Psychroflexus sp. MES1-P1E TaxID=2058320 RepID=UPI002155ABA9|nr:hypothetical protein [Psychroflexus sp. MES1-P1E]
MNNISLTGFGYKLTMLVACSIIDNTLSLVVNETNFPLSEKGGMLNDSDVIKYLLASIYVIASACSNPKLVSNVCVLVPEKTSLFVKFSLTQTKGCNIELYPTEYTFSVDGL